MSTTNPQQHPQVAWRMVGESAALVSPDSPSFFWLNSVGSRIWELSDGTRSPEDIGAQLVEEFEIDLDTSLADTRRFVADLTARGLLVAP